MTGHAGDGDYAWMPDGRSFVFVRKAAKQKPQLYQYTLGTGAIVQLTHVAHGVSRRSRSHAGDRIAFSVTEIDPAHDAYVDFAKAGFKPKGGAEEERHQRHRSAASSQANGQGYTYRDHQHVWTVNADGSNAKQLTSGQYSENFDAWSPDDRTMLVDSLRYESVDSGPNDVYTMPSTGGALEKVASPLPANFGFFFGSDNSRVFFLTGDVKDAAEQPALASANRDGSDRRIVVTHDTVSWGDSLLADMKEGGGLCGAPLPGGKLALLNVDGPGYSNLRTIDLTSGALSDVTPPEGEAWSCSVSHDGTRVAYLYSDFTHPADVYVAPMSGGAPRRLTDVNGAYLASVTISKPQAFTVKDPAGFDVQAWFMPATGGAPGAKHPTLLDIHGGPETQFGDTFFHEFQLYAAMGYNVVFADPAGSTGHGYAFEEALEKNYGDAMFQDVQAVMDAAVKRPDVDASRLGVLGGSYGGYATLWVIAHTNRYKVAVAERGVSNLQSENLAADFAGEKRARRRLLQLGPPWDPASTDYAKFSPLTYVANVHTPLMLLHSDEDTRAPIDQTLQEFTSLKMLRTDGRIRGRARRESRPVANRFADSSSRAPEPDPRLAGPLYLAAPRLGVTGRCVRASYA